MRDCAVDADKMEGLVLIDEIDIHLHPTWQVTLIQALKTTFPRVQFVVTTHSPMVLPGLNKDEILRVKLNDQGSVVVEEVDESPAVMTGSELYEAFFGIEGLYPKEVGAALQKYGYLTSDPYRDDAEEAEMQRLRAAPGARRAARMGTRRPGTALMIRLDRGPEPEPLARIREAELVRVGAIAAIRRPTGDEIGVRYSVARQDLWERQFYKCCFCDFKEQQPYNDVEHYRPKAEAKRSPGSADESGYWWLAWTWENLLFSCASCNRSHKRTSFPLQVGSVPLAPGEAPPGREIPLLIDPFAEDPIDHIQFRPSLVNGRDLWMPFPRSGSEKGRWTIRVAGLDQPRLLDLYREHVEHQVMPRIETIREALAGQDPLKIKDAWNRETRRLLVIRLPFASLSYDALDHFIPGPVRMQFDLALRKPSL